MKEFRLLASSCRPLVLISLPFLVGGTAAAAPQGGAASAQAGAVDAAGVAAAQAELELSRLAYRNAGAFRETMELTLTLPDGRQEPRHSEYGVDPAGNAFLALSHGGAEIFRIVAGAGRMVATQVDVNERYAEVPYQGNFGAALRDMGGDQAQMAALPAMVARQGGNPDEFLAAFRLGVLAPLTIEGFHPGGQAGPTGAAGVPAAAGAPAAAKPAAPSAPPGRPGSPAASTSGDGAPGPRIDFRAANGRLTVELDPSTHFLRHIEAALGDGPQQVRAAGSIRLAAWGAGAPLTWPEVTGRTAVHTLAALDEAGYPLGQPAPKVELRSLEGEVVRPSEMAGTVVVLDFWATWCVPCWTALGHTSEVAAWARGAGLPVKVFAIDTLEASPTAAALRQQALDFLHAKQIDVPVLLDEGGKAFSAFHSPGLPSLVIIDRDGRVARYHSGLLPDMVATLRSEIAALLEPAGQH